MNLLSLFSLDNLHNLLNLLKYIDIFGVEFNSSIFSRKEYRSFSGVILTIILLVLAICKIKVLVSQTNNRTNFNVVKEKDILSGEKQNISMLYITFCSKLFSDGTSYPGEICDNKDIPLAFPEYNEIISNQTESYCYSYNLTNFTLSIGTPESGFTKKIKTLYGSVFGLLSSDTELKIYIDEVFIKSSDYFNPVCHRNYPIVIDVNYPQTLDLYLQTIQAKYKNTYGFGFSKYEPNYKNYTTYYSNRVLGRGEYKSVTDFKFTIQHSDWITTYTFNGFNLDTVISELGGYIIICFIVLNFIGTFINYFLLQYYISINLNKGIIKNDSLKSKIGNDYENNSNTNKNFNIEIASETENLNFGKKRNDITDTNRRHSIQNTARSNEVDCLNFETNQINTEDQNAFKIITGDSKKKLKNPNLIEEKIEEKNEKEEEIFKLYKYECDEICAKINSENELYNKLFNKEISDKEKDKIRKKINVKLFEERMDYNNFDIIFKELKILELLVLNQDNIGSFIEYNKHILDFNKLTALVENKQTQNRIFSSRLYMEYALQKCIV